MKTLDVKRLTAGNLPQHAIKTIRQIMPELSGFSVYHNKGEVYESEWYFGDDPSPQLTSVFEIGSETRRKLELIQDIVLYVSGI
jgi:hypothetical protein